MDPYFVVIYIVILKKIKMKKSILTAVVLFLTITMSFGQSKSDVTEITFGVRGNCGMCKTTIEKAVNSVAGVSHANWDVDYKKIDISFDALKTNKMELHNVIVASGYDTDLSTADEKAYNNLPGCCQYDREMKMNISIRKKDNHSGHKH